MHHLSKITFFRQEQALQEQPSLAELSRLAVVATHNHTKKSIESEAMRILPLREQGRPEKAAEPLSFRTSSRSMHQQDSSQQPTLPLKSLAPNAFSEYLKAHGLLWVDVERASGVPSLVIWSADHGMVINPAQASQIRAGLYRLTGEPYTGPIPTS